MGTQKRERHKANRQARLEAERKAAAQAKRKRQLVTAVVVAIAVVAALFLINLLGGGDDEPDDEAGTGTTSTTQPTLTTVEPGEEPTVAVPEGEPPAELVSEDLVVGEGDAAEEGDRVALHYVGVKHSTGEQFESSYGAEPFEFVLGEGGAIDGWQQGVPGMQLGGRRRLVIPPELAYGSTGQGDIGPDETLVFEVELVGIG